MTSKFILGIATLLLTQAPLVHADCGTPWPSFLDDFKGLAVDVFDAVHRFNDPCMNKLIAFGGLNPSVRDLSNQICASNDHCVLKAAIDEAWKEILKKDHIPVEVMYAVAVKESTWQHWIRGTPLTDGNVLPSYNNSSFGLLQINAIHKSEFAASAWESVLADPSASNEDRIRAKLYKKYFGYDGWEKVMHDPLTNARAGAMIFKEDYDLEKSKYASREDAYVKAYSDYTGGGGAEFTDLFREHLDHGDWLIYTKGCPKP